ncbi:MAG: PH domain-containing protein [Nitriliruptoraceae bacterium]
MRYPERLLSSDEEIIRQFRPHWKVLLPSIGWAMLLAAVAGIATAMLSLEWMWWSAGLAVALWILLSVRSLVNWYATNYVLTNERIVVRRGLIARTGTEIPLENITNVLFSQRVLERLLGYGDVTIESAGSQGQSRLADIPDPEAFQSQVYRARELRTLHFRSGGQTAARDVVQQLEALADLRERGHLSDEEFAANKRALLGDLPGVDPAEVRDRTAEGEIDPTA